MGAMALRLFGPRISSTWSVLRIIFSQIGVKPDEYGLRSMLLEDRELSLNGWTNEGDWTYRIGAGLPQTDEIQRARMQGGVTARRRLRAEDGRSVTVSISRFASTTDVQSY